MSELRQSPHVADGEAERVDATDTNECAGRPVTAPIWQPLVRWWPSAWHALASLHGQRRVAWALTVVALLLDMALVGGHALVRYQAYHAQAFDLGNMDQAVWNTLHGSPFRFTNQGLDWFGPPTRLGVHVEPILVLLAPLYLLHQGPETLIVVQLVALVLGGIPLMLLGLRHLPQMPLVATAFVCAYLAAPEVLGEALWDFHAVALATPLLLLALWALDTRRTAVFVLAAVLASLCKEDVALSLVPLGVLIALRLRRPRLGTATAVVAALWAAACFMVILPHFNQGVTGGNNFWYRYSWLGDSPQSAIKDILTDPALPFSMLVTAARLGYLATLLRTAGGLGLFAPLLWICALPSLAVNLLSTHQEQYSAFFQYNAVLMPYVMVAGVVGTEALYHACRAREVGAAPVFPAFRRAFSGAHGESVLGSRTWRTALSGCRRWVGDTWLALLARIPLPSGWIAPLVVIWLVVSTIWNLSATSSQVVAFWQAGAAPWSDAPAVSRLLAEIPQSATVAATDSLDPHLTDRYTIYLMPDPRSYDAEYVAVDVSDAIVSSQAADSAIYQAMRASGKYVLVGTVSSVTVLRRVGPPST